MSPSTEALAREILHLDAELAKAKRSLTLCGFEDRGGELWMPPLGPSSKPLLQQIDHLTAVLVERDKRIAELEDGESEQVQAATSELQRWRPMQSDLHGECRALVNELHAITTRAEKAEADLAVSLAEQKRLTLELGGRPRGWLCAYCGYDEKHAADADERTILESQARLRNHLATCPRHPLAHALAALRDRDIEVVSLRTQLDWSRDRIRTERESYRLSKEAKAAAEAGDEIRQLREKLDAAIRLRNEVAVSELEALDRLYNLPEQFKNTLGARVVKLRQEQAEVAIAREVRR
jgi:hypothetical protein